MLKLKEKNIKNAFALLGGTSAWKTAGYPMEGEPPTPPASPKINDKN